jgi:2-dehydropantoate 2-reductase
MPPCDLILVCIKTTANGHLLELLKPLARTGTDILLIQNGLGAEAMVQAAFPDSHVFGGLAFLCARKSDTRPGVIEHLDYGALKIGAWGCSKALAGRLAAIACRLSQAGIPVQTSDSLTCARWEKLVWNMPFNGLAVVLDKTTATILALQETREAVREHMLEVITVANLFGCPLSTELAETMIRNTDAMVDYTPSMLLDYRRGDQLELDYIYRNPIRAAVSAGADMPISRYLLGQLVQIQKTA